MPVIPHFADTDQREHDLRWLDHVRAGRIGPGPTTTPRQLLQHMRNEEVFLGKAVSVRVKVSR
ncbi:MAG: hypothetical protein H6915_02340 [Novosphingobium sp.]|nr:hypothetical protein [Novosphingobium sp.]